MTRFLYILILPLILNTLTSEARERDPVWAEPVPCVYLKNMFRVDEGFYRCEQPSPAGFRELYEMGIREVLNFRNRHTDNDEAGSIPLTLHHLPMRAGKSKTGEFAEALRIIHNRRGPIVIHCWHGSDRTGVISALYRLVFQGWTKEEAIDELRNGGYGYHEFWFGNIITYLENVDVDELRRAVIADDRQN